MRLLPPGRVDCCPEERSSSGEKVIGGGACRGRCSSERCPDPLIVVVVGSRSHISRATCRATRVFSLVEEEESADSVLGRARQAARGLSGGDVALAAVSLGADVRVSLRRSSS